MGEMATSSWENIVTRKRQAQADAIAAIGNIEVTNNDSITNIDDTEALSGMIQAGNTSAEHVVKSYIARVVETHKKTNCLTEVLFQDALEHARKLDKSPADQGTVVGPLQGVPMTLKDQFNVKGHDTTLGYVGRAFSPAAEDAALVKMLQSLGAIMLAKTNLPQSIMWCETENPLFGLTTNPLDPKYTPGGSTGGEAALLSQNATMVGWGTDIGGSIRIPSHMMGLYGLKPSSARLPYHGLAVSTEGQEHVPSTVGPMARSLSSITHVMKSLVDLKPWDFDARCAPIPWRGDVYQSIAAPGSRPLTIGVLADDGVIRPHPPITRVLESAVALFKKAGHDIVPWDASLHAELVEVMDAFYTVDGGEDIRRDVLKGGEPFIPHVEKLVNRGKPISVYEYWQLNRRKWALQQAYLEKWKRLRSPTTGREVDVVLMPPMPHASVPHGACRWVGYTKVWNVLDFSALVIPGGKIGGEDAAAEWEFDARNDVDAWNAKLWTDNKKDMIRLGLPVGVQIVGRKLEEEKVLAVGKVLDDLLKQQAK